jgi:adenylate cyclase class 2
MAIEIEVKAHAEDLKEVETRILAKGAELTWQGEQRDTYYNHPNRDFAQTDEALRVRETQGRAVLTYKGPKLDPSSKTREEIELEIADSASMKPLLAKLGFTEVALVIKQRTKYAMDDLMVCLDDVVDVGKFVEIEVSVPSIESEARVSEERDRIIDVMKDLGLSKFERTSYLELLLEK